MRVRGLELRFGERTYVMGIVNVTPDSFSGDGLLTGGSVVEAALLQVEQMVADGADIVDIGGESTRPGHAPLDAITELDRTIAVVAGVRTRFADLPISIDTSKPAVAVAALEAGADIVNDVAGVTAQATLAPVAAAHAAPYIVTHSRATPEYDDVVAETVADLRDALELAEGHGCDPRSLIVDPGIGFGKTPDQSIEALAKVRALHQLGLPILVGASRKRFIDRIDPSPVTARIGGSLAAHLHAAEAGAAIIRAHDVRETVQALKVRSALGAAA